MYQIDEVFKKIKSISEKELNNLKDLNNYKKKIKLDLKRCFICDCFPKDIFLKKIMFKKEKYIFFPVYICSNCGMAQQLFSFDGGFHYYYYKNVISKNLKITKDILNKNHKLSYDRGKFIYDKFKKFFLNRKLRILDIGSGTGGLLNYFREKGHYVYGNEPNINYFKYSKQKIKNIINKNFEDIHYQKNFFDLVLVIGTFEHVNSPINTLNKINYITKKKSIMIVDTKGYPNDRLENYFNFNHHRCFSKKTLQYFLKKNHWSKLTLDYDFNYTNLKLNKNMYSRKLKPKKIKKGNLLGIFIKKKIKKINIYQRDKFFLKF